MSAPRNRFRRTEHNLNSLRLALLLRKGGVVAHFTSTIPGVACLPQSGAVKRLQRFKQRSGPFLLLADSVPTTRKLIRWYPAMLRRLIREAWPGRTTLIVPGRPGLPACCYDGGKVAVRVDADPACRRLANACGGVLLSSSLNRRGRALAMPTYRTQMRWHAFLAGRAGVGESAGSASELYRVDHRREQKLR